MSEQPPQPPQPPQQNANPIEQERAEKVKQFDALMGPTTWRNPQNIAEYEALSPEDKERIIEIITAIVQDPEYRAAWSEWAVDANDDRNKSITPGYHRRNLKGFSDIDGAELSSTLRMEGFPDRVGLGKPRVQIHWYRGEDIFALRVDLEVVERTYSEGTPNTNSGRGGPFIFVFTVSAGTGRKIFYDLEKQLDDIIHIVRGLSAQSTHPQYGDMVFKKSNSPVVSEVRDDEFTGLKWTYLHAQKK